MIRVAPIHLVVATLLATLAHGVLLVSISLKSRLEAEPEPKSTIYLELATLSGTFGEFELSAPATNDESLPTPDRADHAEASSDPVEFPDGPPLDDAFANDAPPPMPLPPSPPIQVDETRPIPTPVAVVETVLPVEVLPVETVLPVEAVSPVEAVPPAEAEVLLAPETTPDVSDMPVPKFEVSEPPPAAVPKSGPVSTAAEQAPVAEPTSQPITSAPAFISSDAAQTPARAGATTKYIGDLYQRLNRAARRDYPWKSIERREEGVVPLRLTVLAGGELESVEVVDRSQAPERLIDAAVRAVQRSAPFPSFPSEMGSDSETFDVRIIYKL